MSEICHVRDQGYTFLKLFNLTSSDKESCICRCFNIVSSNEFLDQSLGNEVGKITLDEISLRQMVQKPTSLTKPFIDAVAMFMSKACWHEIERRNMERGVKGLWEKTEARSMAYGMRVLHEQTHFFDKIHYTTLQKESFTENELQCHKISPIPWTCSRESLRKN